MPRGKRRPGSPAPSRPPDSSLMSASEHAGYRTSAGWLTSLARCSQGASNAASDYLEATGRCVPPLTRAVPIRQPPDLVSALTTCTPLWGTPAAVSASRGRVAATSSHASPGTAKEG
jgi:hypothetical protein